MRTNVLTTLLLVLFLASVLVGQDAKNANEKIEKIKGEANKIVITTDKENVVFEGDEAKALLKKLKSHRITKKLKWVSEDGEDINFGDDNIIVFKSKGGKKHIIKQKGHGSNMLVLMDDDDDIDILDGEKKIKVEVEDENGEKEVTVTTNENGEEKVETYKGKEADEYLEKMKDENNVIIDIDVDSDGDNVWFSKDDFDDDRIEKEVKVTVDDGEKLVTVKTTEDGKESVKTYKGKDADEYLEKLEKEDKMKIEEKIINGKKVKKIIIKEIEEDEKEEKEK